jgi:phosphoribosylaminoimidazole-succinocarboxamide synthase
MAKTALLQTDFPGLQLVGRGKVRDIYDFNDKLLIVVTDRISAFDCIMPKGIPDKGKLLNTMASFWFELLGDIVPNHTITGKVSEYPAECAPYAADLEQRSLLVKKAQVFPIECVVRGYLAGSGWKDYQQRGEVCGHKLPAGLRQGDKLPEPLFTPATKAETGHDENISKAQAAKIIGQYYADILEETSIKLYKKAADYALERGIIIADTKFEFGLIEGQVHVVDEVLTPDSSRFWDAETYEPGKDQPSFDKQFVRDYLETLDWDKTPPAPALPDEIVEGSSKRYHEALVRLTGKDL